MRQCADESQPCHPGHAMDETAEVSEVAFTGGVQHGAGSEEQQALHERVVQRVVHDRDQGERRRGAHARAGKTMASPSPVNKMPTFSIDEYASRRFMSVWAAAKTTP